MGVINCNNPSPMGIILRLVIAIGLIVYGAVYNNYIVLAIGCIPIVRLGIYFNQKETIKERP